MSGRVRIVLVEPQEPGNVGAVTRAMKNFGFRDLVVVGPRIEPDGHALWWSSGAEDLLGSIRYASSLEEALEGVHVAVATTSSRARNVDRLLDPAGVAEEALRLSDAQTLAVVFGRERSGLTADEIGLCGLHATIRTSPELPVMNLAQSVAVFCYELSQPRVAAEQQAGELAPFELENRLHDRARQMLVDVGYLYTTHPERLYREMRAVAARARLTQREVEIFLGAIAKLEWALKNQVP